MAKAPTHLSEPGKAPLDPSSFRNAVLAALPPDESRELRPHLTRARLIRGQILIEPGERAEHCWFVEQGFISMVAQVSGGISGVEVGLIGREGVVGLVPMLSGEALSYNCAMVQMAGEARRVPLAVLRRTVDRLPVLRRLLMRALAMEMAHVSQSAACNSRHSVGERCARWLLLARDRLDSDELPLTQEFLSLMLAVRRPGVTMALSRLQRAGLIRSHRGVITIVDRAGLKDAACDCYAQILAYEARLGGQVDALD